VRRHLEGSRRYGKASRHFSRGLQHFGRGSGKSQRVVEGCSPHITPLSRRSDRTSDLEGNLAKADGSEASRGSGVLTIELIYELQGINVSFVNPGVLLTSVTFPSDQELKAMSVEAAVEDCLEFVLRLSFDNHRIGRRRRASSGNGIDGHTKEFDPAEYWVK
jgi:hypothetical protein